MDFVKYADIDMSCLQGYVTTTYDKLVEVFGEPHFSGEKTTAEWAVKFADGTIATIYDYKEYSTPMGEYDWHIGGYDKYAVKRVQELFK